MEERPLKIVCVIADHGGCGYYRVFSPYTMLQRAGHEVYIAENYWLITLPGLEYHPAHPERHQEPWRPDVIVLQRPGNADEMMALYASKNWGVPVIVEYDDLLWNVPGWNPAHHIWYSKREKNEQKSSIHVLKLMISQADAITVSTQHLADETRKRHPKKPVYVLPNYMATGDWPAVDHERRWQETGKVWVGWGGSSTHKMDLLQITGLVGQVAAKVPWLNLYTFGGYQPAMQYLANGLAPERKVEAGWVGLSDVPGVAANIDIGLAPLDPHPFNSSKSDLKAMEYALIGAPTISSDGPTYRTFIRHGDNGFLARNFRDWLRCLEVLATDHPKRIEMGLRARQDVLQRDIALHVDEWEAALRDIIARKAMEVGKVEPKVMIQI